MVLMGGGGVSENVHHSYFLENRCMHLPPLADAGEEMWIEGEWDLGHVAAAMQEFGLLIKVIWTQTSMC